MSGQEKIYEMVTDQILEKLDKGTVPWQRPWKEGKFFQPCNIKTGKNYRGINILLLACSGYSSRFWGSYKQIQGLGGQVKQGEKGNLCIFWKIHEIEKENERGEKIKKKIPLLRYFKIFNLDQTEGIDDPDKTEVEIQNNNPIQSAEYIINMPNRPKIRHNEQRAYYSPLEDFINLPKFNSFRTSEEYYSIAFHELVHSTGHKSRLNRKSLNEMSLFGSEDYSFEELIAEFGAAFLCAEIGIENKTIDNSASYIDNWRKKLTENKKWVVQASGKAQKAVNFIMNRDKE